MTEATTTQTTLDFSETARRIALYFRDETAAVRLEAEFVSFDGTVKNLTAWRMTHDGNGQPVAAPATMVGIFAPSEKPVYGQTTHAFTVYPSTTFAH